MEIGPIPPLRPAVIVKPSRSIENLNAVSAVEFGRDHDDTYSPHDQRRPSRGMEGEGDDMVTLGAGENELEAQTFVRGGEGEVNFFV